MSRSRKEMACEFLKDFLWCVLSFIVILLFIFLGYLLATIPSWFLLLKPLAILKWSAEYLSVPIIMIVSAIIVYRQWKINNFIELRNRLIDKEKIYRRASMKLNKKFLKLEKDNKLTLEIHQKLYDKRQYILSQYLNEIEALALYIDESIIHYKLVRKYFNDWLLSLSTDDVIMEFISEQRKELDSEIIFEYTLTLLERVKKEKTNG